MTLLGGEDAVGFGGGDGERAGDGGELVLVDEAGMGYEADLDAVLVVADNVLSNDRVRKTGTCGSYRRGGDGRENAYLGAKAVAETTNVGKTELSLHVLERIDNDGINGLLVMGVLAVAALSEPLHNVKASRHGNRKLVLVEEINDQGGVAIGGELVGEKL